MSKINQVKRERSVAYPALSLDRAIESSSELRTKLGKGPYGREDAAVALGHKGVSGASATKIASLVHFGLLTRNGNTYSQSELGERINHPLSDYDRTEAILEVMKTPKLYKDLFDQFTGQAIPTQLANILVRKGVSSKVAQTVADDFKSSAEFSGCLKNGVLFNDAEVAIDRDNSEKKECKNNVFDFADFGFSTKKDVNPQSHIHNDSGNGWVLTIKTGKPLTSDVKTKLIVVTELLEKINEDKQ